MAGAPDIASASPAASIATVRKTGAGSSTFEQF
jgi:hypothetical protein